MTILYLLIPLSLILLGLAVWAFFWAVKNDQFDDLEGPAHRILFDEDENDLSPEQRRQRQQTKQKNAAPADANSPDDPEPRS
ncbi:cbb3-type cytochrome oxidase assembly protein CcoS [Halomonas sp. FeN2]|uniref:Cbb3-type cytochrome oxidase assembly protein CcoS n=1 Tax=Vreelandella neptunia TaxID=115551 RepID=A0ABZ0YI66_9GAMM|nr:MULTISPECIES: cbb3-type cytochrome oxidase assembly protein CcoS [Halomonas]MBF58156.1 cbb3-type cytochrome oxidase assembly protein CcoS [Halomonas sp.]MDN3559591.1 cbb3-type cytochrome oxidase assembly protein CcoS [Halomonas neptunia]UBR51097.1 cbb3-type cytochrome oxidase assembly protein CcoS [Halomonas sp. FeN2]WQH11631.1 cbb3-type cytochrome oxidase assembly protein CcoS [Halomonas neptunia]|tara:strand:- start:1802 stop:2047 length:246 start_codon:yes stop_codon:yes gene_type:complete